MELLRFWKIPPRSLVVDDAERNASLVIGGIMTRRIQPRAHNHGHYRGHLRVGNVTAAAPSCMVVITQFVIEWVRVRIPSKAWIYLRENKSDFRLKWIPVSKEK
ncbi:hypothetical protein TNCV_1720761 [Trichonephila clavipes]|nr:hypothetical protein TNCV_1720761 [Trichonephila clavipes]